jgi:uncharacterized protein
VQRYGTRWTGLSHPGADELHADVLEQDLKNPTVPTGIWAATGTDITPDAFFGRSCACRENVMTGFLSEDELARLTPSELVDRRTPIPTQIVSSDEYFPAPQSEKQRAVEAHLNAMADELGGKQGLDRRHFFQTAVGMAAAFVAMNEIYGSIFDATLAEASNPAMAQERADGLKDQFIMDMHTHFLRDDTRNTNFLEMRKGVEQLGWNKELHGEQTIEDLKFANYIKEMFLDSDTKIALISSAPSDVARDWLLTNAQMAAARTKVNDKAAESVKSTTLHPTRRRLGLPN